MKLPLGPFQVSVSILAVLFCFFSVATAQVPNPRLSSSSMFEDGTGRKFVPREIAAKIASAANAPTYSVYDMYVGKGIVGGYMDTFGAVGRAIGSIRSPRMFSPPITGASNENIAVDLVDGRTEYSR